MIHQESATRDAFSVRIRCKVRVRKKWKQGRNHEKQKRMIFATSMIAPELDDPKYTIGENYTIENKSLKMYR